jgi:PRTRC genetic system protein E
MFTELLPVLKDRMVTLILSRLDENLVRVIVVPQRKSDKENSAAGAAENELAIPLTITGTAEELDREFAQQLQSFSGSYERAASNIREVENAHAAAVKAAEEEKKNANGKRPSTTPAKAIARAKSDSPAPAIGKPVFGNKTQVAFAATTQSLFDPQPAEEAESAATVKPESSSETEPAQDQPRPTVTVVDAAVADSVEQEKNAPE